MTAKGDEKKLSRFFKDLEELDDSEEEDEEETDDPAQTSQPVTKNDSNRISGPFKSDSDKDSATKLDDKETPESHEKDNLTLKPQRLPSAHDCLKTQSSPEFLKILNKKDVDWDRLHKVLPGEDGDAGLVQDYQSNAVPPPTSYEPQTDPGIKVVDSEGRKRKTVGDDLEDQNTSTKAYKVHPPEEG